PAPRPRSSTSRRKTRIRIGQVAVILLVIAVWALVHRLGLLSENVLPSVGAVAVEIVTVFVSPEFWASLGWTLGSALIALLIALAVGVPVGLLLGITPAVRRATQVIFDFGRSFPIIALMPLMALVLGTNQVMEITLITIGLVWAIVTQAIDGSRRLDPVIADTVRAYGIGRGLRFWKVVLPNAAPYLVTGLRIAATAALLIALAIELLAMLPGLGGQIARAQQYQAPALALAYVFYAGVVAMILNMLLWRAEAGLLAWSRRAVAR
ncbi:ABC transporter permease, partial [Microbacterium sp. 18062]|uniref:ABC transporter permease n=1 Tax=Microbacterium sp. 18062 TaxID=2681410 RepID=UPI00135B60F2